MGLENVERFYCRKTPSQRNTTEIARKNHNMGCADLCIRPEASQTKEGRGRIRASCGEGRLFVVVSSDTLAVCWVSVGIKVSALLGEGLSDLDDDTMGIRIGVMPNAGHLP